MKKLKLLVMPLMAISFLASCSKGKSTYTVTFDAGTNGKFFNDEQTISFELKKGKKLLPYIQLLTPTLEGYSFAYYEYKGIDKAIDYDDVATSDITIKANYYLSSTVEIDNLDDFDWKTIKNIAVTGNPSLWFKPGATKTIRVENKDCLVRIIDFRYDYIDIEKPDDSRVGITFDFVNTISDFTTNWNNKQAAASTNHDFINTSNLNECLQPGGEVYKIMPSDLMSIVATVNKKVMIKPDGEWIEGSYNTKLFPLSIDEIGGDNSNTYEYYRNDSKNKRTKDAVYWLRSPYEYVSDYAWSIYTDGTGYYRNITNCEFAVAPAFCI